MLCFILPATDPALNLATEEYLLQKSQEECFLVWRNHQAVIIGRNQNPWAEVNPDFVLKEEIPLIRRLSGGGAVYHDLGNVNFSFILPKVESGYLPMQICLRPIIDFLRTYDVEIRFDCKNSLLLGDRKISGSAQFFSARKLLQHGTLMFDVDLDRLNQALYPGPGNYLDAGTVSNRFPVGNLKPHLPEFESEVDFASHLLRFVCRRHNGRLGKLSAVDLEAISTLAAQKYRSWAWNFASFPQYRLFRVFRAAGATWHIYLRAERGIIREARILANGVNASRLRLLEEGLVGCRHWPADITTRLAQISWDGIAADLRAAEVVRALF